MSKKYKAFCCGEELSYSHEGDIPSLAQDPLPQIEIQGKQYKITAVFDRPEFPCIYVEVVRVKRSS